MMRKKSIFFRSSILLRAGSLEYFSIVRYYVQLHMSLYIAFIICEFSIQVNTVIMYRDERYVYVTHWDKRVLSGPNCLSLTTKLWLSDSVVCISEASSQKNQWPWPYLLSHNFKVTYEGGQKVWEQSTKTNFQQTQSTRNKNGLEQSTRNKTWCLVFTYL